VEGAALHGVGVFETLKAISRKTLAAVHRKISGEEELPASVKRKVEAAPAQVREPAPVYQEAVQATAAQSSEALFAELHDELDPEAVAFTDAPVVEAQVAVEESASEAVPETESPPPGSKTAEVKVEFALNPAVVEESGRAAKGTVRKVETKSRLDIERELEKLRRMALGAGRGKKAEPPPVVLTGKGTAPISADALEKASGVVVDLRFVSESSSHPAPGVVRIELPPREKGARTRLQLEIEIEEDGGD
jgi:hypothetical protein